MGVKYLPSEDLGYIKEAISGELRRGLRAFCLERWQSLHENYAKLNMSESGVSPLKLYELEELGLNIESLREIEIGYGWTRGSPELRERISELYGGEVEEEEILITNGSAEANLVAALTTVSENYLYGTDVPNYMQLPGLAPFLGGKMLKLMRSHPSWEFPVGEAVRLIEEKRPKAFFICNPNNPTTKVMKENALEELGDAARRSGTILIFDEVYWGSELHGDRKSALEIIGKDVAVSISGLSKVYGMPGLRIGWIAGNKGLVNKAWAFKDYTSIAPSVLSDKIASTVLKPDSIKRLRERSRSILKKNSDAFSSKLSDVLEIVPPEAGMFAWARVPWTNDTLEISWELFKDRGILVNPGECFDSPGFLRIGLGHDPSSFPKHAEELRIALQMLREKSVYIGK